MYINIYLQFEIYMQCKYNKLAVEKHTFSKGRSHFPLSICIHHIYTYIDYMYTYISGLHNNSIRFNYVSALKELTY